MSDPEDRRLLEEQAIAACELQAAAWIAEGDPPGVAVLRTLADAHHPEAGEQVAFMSGATHVLSAVLASPGLLPALASAVMQAIDIDPDDGPDVCDRTLARLIERFINEKS